MQPMSYVPRFCQKKDLVKIHICGKFYQCSVWGCEVKFFQSFCITSESMKELLFWGVGWEGGGALGPYSTKYCSILLKLWPELVSNKINAVWKIIQNFAYFGSNGTHLKFTVLTNFAAQFTAGKPKVLPKTKIFAKSTYLEISNNVNSRSQKNHRILVKLNKKIFWGPQIRSKLPPGVTPKGDQKFSHSLY